MDIQLLLYSLAIYSPALAANGGATFISEGKPIDLGKSLRDGRRILGDGKTFEGFLFAMTFGSTVSIGIGRLLGEVWTFYGIMAALGALVGDMIGAFIKRRMGLKRGERALGLDQLDFVLGSTAFMLLAGAKITLVQFLFIALLSFALHLVTNAAAYRLKIKRVPW